MKILIVEDNAIISMELKTFLSSAGFNVVGVAKSGLTAIEIAKEQKPDVVLMDVGVKGDLDGIQIASTLNDFMTYHLFYLSGNDLLKDNQRAIDTQPVGFISKPVNLNLLISLISDLDRREAV